ncbi:MAG: hypothetical protein KJZ64_06575 [Sphingomonadaceae bacterium]|nr:hypothetical protein [Sphingomonadaceae bacterium]
MSAAITTLVAIAKKHGLIGELADWSERSVWWFDAPMPDAVRAAGDADPTLRYWSFDGSPHNPADEGFSDADRLSISFLRAK